MNFRARYAQPGILDPEHEALNAPAIRLNEPPALLQTTFYPEDDGIEINSDDDPNDWVYLNPNQS
jgi:hypothetical protein